MTPQQKRDLEVAQLLRDAAEELEAGRGQAYFVVVQTVDPASEDTYFTHAASGFVYGCGDLLLEPVRDELHLVEREAIVQDLCLAFGGEN